MQTNQAITTVSPENPCIVVGVGAANMDVHGRSRKCVVMRDSNPGFLSTSAGGVTRNILENLARQGVTTGLLAAVGDDVYGEKILRDTASAGVDVSRVDIRTGENSSCYIAMLDDLGDMLLGMSDMRISEQLSRAYLEHNAAYLCSARAIVCDACLQPAFLSHLLELAGDTPVFIDPVSTAYARQMLPLTPRFYGIKPNEMELAVLTDMQIETECDIERACEKLLHDGVNCIAVSRGKKGCYYADANGARMFRSLRPVERMVNATGAGDAFMAGFLHGFVNDTPIEARLDYALASGITALLSLTTIAADMSDARVASVLEEYRA